MPNIRATPRRGVRKNAKTYGLKIVYDKTYPPSTTDYSPIIRAVQATEPDEVFVASYPLDTVGMVRAANEVGLKTKLFGGGMVGLQTTSVKVAARPADERHRQLRFLDPGADHAVPGRARLPEEVPGAGRQAGGRSVGLLPRPLGLRLSAGAGPGGRGRRQPRPGQDRGLSARPHLQDGHGRHRVRRGRRARGIARD